MLTVLLNVIKESKTNLKTVAIAINLKKHFGLTQM